MIDAGLPLVQALEILSTQVENKFLAKTLALSKMMLSPAQLMRMPSKNPKGFYRTLRQYGCGR